MCRKANIFSGRSENEGNVVLEGNSFLEEMEGNVFLERHVLVILKGNVLLEGSVFLKGDIFLEGNVFLKGIVFLEGNALFWRSILLEPGRCILRGEELIFGGEGTDCVPQKAFLKLRPSPQKEMFPCSLKILTVPLFPKVI